MKYRFPSSLVFAVFFFASLQIAWAASVSLSWFPNSESDIAGYKVYRWMPSPGVYLPITGVFPATSYTDSSVQAGLQYYYVVTAVNTSGLESEYSAPVAAFVPSTPSVPVNQAPVINAGADQTAFPGAYVVLGGTASDPEGEPVHLSWSQTGGPAVALEGTHGTVVSFKAPTVSTSTLLTFTLEANDGKGGVSRDSVQVQVAVGVNAPPVADAGIDSLAASGQKVKLVGTGSDLNGSKLTFSWTQRSGPAVSILDAALPVANFVAPKVTSTTTLLFRLTVNDPSGASAYDDVRVFVAATDSTNFTFPSSTIGITPLLDDATVRARLTNLSAVKAQHVLDSFDAAGTISWLRTNPLQPFAVDTYLTSSLKTAPDAGLRINRSDLAVRGLLQIRDGSATRVDSLGSQTPVVSTLYFPGVSLAASSNTMLLVGNPDPALSADVTFKVIAPDGALLKQSQITLPRSAIRRGSLSTFVGSLPASPYGYYLRVSSTRLVEAFAIQADDESITMLPGQLVSPASRLWMPHFVVGLAGEDTDLSLVNELAQPIRIRVKAFGASGELAYRDATIAAHGMLNVRIGTFLPLQTLLAGKSSASGYLTLDVIYPNATTTGQKPPLAGVVRFLGAGHRAKAVLPLQSVGRRENVCLNVVQNLAGGQYTGLVILNTGTTMSSATVEAYNASGVRTASKTISIPSSGRFVGMLDSPSLFGAGFQQVGGHLRIVSSQPVVTFAMFGDTAGEYLSTIDSQSP